MPNDGAQPPREPDPFETVDPSSLRAAELSKASEPEQEPEGETEWTVVEGAISPRESVGSPGDTDPIEPALPRDLGESTVSTSNAEDDDPYLTYVPTEGGGEESLEPVRPTSARFRPVRSHARGGLGEVLLAIDEELRREVALKRIRDQHADDPDSRARFLLEAEITGNLEHPGVVPVYGLGVHENGRPYYAMRFIRGENLKEAIDTFHRDDPERQRLGQRPPGLRKLLNRFIDVCNTIHYAHSRGVIHRDIKPVNVMLGPYGETLVVDWGLAKPVGVGGAEEPPESPPETAGIQPQPAPGQSPRYEPSVEACMAVTQAGFAIGTPAYISPEQAEGRLQSVGPASDIFCLGATLYEILTGRPPYQGDGVVSVIAEATQARFPSPRKVNPRVPAALEAVCLKAMAKEPLDRYASAHALAEDVERWLVDDPVSALRESVVRRAGRWVRRNLVAAIVAGLVQLVVIVAVVSYLMVFLAHIKEEAALRESRAALFRAETSRKKADDQRKAAEAAGKEAAVARDLAEVRLYGTSIALSQAELQNAKIARADELLDRCAAPLRGWEWSYLKRLGHTEAATLWGHGNVPTRVRFEADGRSVRSADAEGRVILWDLQTARMKETRLLLGPVGALHTSRPLALASSRDYSAVWLHNVESIDPPRRLEGISGVLRAVEFSPDGRWAAVGSGAGEIAVWRIDSPKEPAHRFKSPQGPIVALAFTTDGSHLASSSVGGWIDVWKLEADSGKALVRHVQAHPGTAAYIVDLEFSRDGRWLASASHDATVHLWDWSADPIAAPRILRGHQFAVWTVAFSPDGKVLASGGDSTVRLWDVASGHELSVLLGHGDYPMHLAFSPDGRRIASAAKDVTVKVWDVPGDVHAGDPAVSLGTGVRRVASGEEKDAVGAGLPPPSDERPARRVFHDHQDAVSTVALTPDGRTLVTGGWDGRVTVRDLITGRVVVTKKALFSVGSVDVHPDGRRVAVGYGGMLSSRVGSVALWDHTTDRNERTFTGLTGPVSAVKFSADGRRLLAATGAVARAFPDKGQVVVWDVAGGEELLRLKEFRVGVLDAEFSPDGATIATTAPGDGAVRLWDAKSGKLVRELGDPSTFRRALTFSPDGKTLAAAGTSIVDLFDVATGLPLKRLRGHRGEVYTVTFGPDGGRLATSGQEGLIKVWSVASGEEILTLRDHGNEVYELAFSRDGRTLASGSFDRSAIVRDARPIIPPDTSGWDELFADDFSSGQTADRYHIYDDSWAIQSGVAAGTTVQRPVEPKGFLSALMVPKVLLPATAEVEFDARSDLPLNLEVKFHDEGFRPRQGLCCVMLGRSDTGFHAGDTGATVLLETSGAYREIASTTRHPFEPGKPHHVRVIREPRRVTLYLDGEEVLTTESPLMDLPILHIQASTSSALGKVTLDNLRIRTPQSTRMERQALEFLARMEPIAIAKADLLDRVAKEAGVGPEARKIALGFLERYVDDPIALAQASADIARQPGLPAADYERALRLAEEAMKGAPDLSKVTGNLGLAQYRAGRFEESVKTLARAIEQRALRDQMPPNAADVAVTAMAQARLGREDAAREALDYLGESATNPAVQNDAVSLSLLKEAETVVGSSLATQRRLAIERLTGLGRTYGVVATKAGKLVPTDIRSKSGKPLLSWRVALLPALGQEALYNEFHLDEPWDSPHNKPLLGRMPEVFVSPHDPDRAGMTHVTVVKGKGTVYDPALPDGVPILDVKDGTINTLLFVESAEGIPWTEPRDVEFEEGKPLPKLGAAPTGRFTFMLVNGIAGALKYEANREILPRLMLRSDGQPKDFRAAVKP